MYITEDINEWTVSQEVTGPLMLNMELPGRRRGRP